MDINWLNANYLPWLIPVPPLLSFFVIVLFLGRYKGLSSVYAMVSVLVSWLMAWGVFFHATATENFGVEGTSFTIYGSGIDWMNLGPKVFRMGVAVDPLSAVMLFMVPFAMLMIFIYSIGYMSAYPEDDPHQIRYSRFFAYLSLFAGGMLTLVVADNLLLLFMGWEVMGLCSYLLIGFIIERKSAYQAAVKAFMTTRIADVVMLLGIGYLFALTGTLSFREIFYDARVLDLLVNTDTPFFGISAASFIGTCLVIGTVGKAAQFPLQGWLPDAMEGPTPVCSPCSKQVAIRMLATIPCP
jgi:NADH-quinone oxidoreductase subunit L